MLVPVFLMMANSKYFLINLMGQDPVVSEITQSYIRLMIPGIFFNCIFESFAIFFTAMEKSIVPMTIQMLVIPIHFTICYIFVQELHFGMQGAALASNISFLISFLLIFMYMQFQNAFTLDKATIPKISF